VSGFADTESGFADYNCPVLIAPRQLETGFRGDQLSNALLAPMSYEGGVTVHMKASQAGQSDFFHSDTNPSPADETLTKLDVVRRPDT
jgi:hypothetical protein